MAPLFIAVCVVVLSEIRTAITTSDLFPPRLLGFAVLFYVLGSCLRYTIADAFGEERIGSFFEKKAYTTEYYVNLFPKEDHAKNYRLPADIQVYHEEQDGDGEVASNSKKCIRLKRVYFPGGSFINFTDYGTADDLAFGRKILEIDDTNKDWYVELVDEKVK